MEKKNNNLNKNMSEKESLILKEYSKQFYFWYSFNRLDLLFTPNEHISDKFTLSILARLWIFKMLKRNIKVKGIFNNAFLYPYLQFNLFFNTNKATIETLKKYLKILGFILLNVSYLSLIFYYDTLVYDKVMNEWFVEIMTPKYIINKE